MNNPVIAVRSVIAVIAGSQSGFDRSQPREAVNAMANRIKVARTIARRMENRPSV
jgi:Tfp pilus assembly protein FimT